MRNPDLASAILHEVIRHRKKKTSFRKSVLFLVSLESPCASETSSSEGYIAHLALDVLCRRCVAGESPSWTRESCRVSVSSADLPSHNSSDAAREARETEGVQVDSVVAPLGAEKRQARSSRVQLHQTLFEATCQRSAYSYKAARLATIMAASVDAKLLRQTKFPPEFNQKVDIKKVNVEVMKK